jgi:hypothetical protein
MRHIDNNDWHFVHLLVIVDPGIEQRGTNRSKEEEDDNPLVLDQSDDFFTPDGT